jgi:TDG/mug DNA glycosylase family protein
LLVGINPSLRSAELGQHFARPGNRFWPALHAAGLTPRRYWPGDQDALAALGIGVTNLCPRPTVRADEVAAQELRDGAAGLLAKLEGGPRPAVVAVLGVTAYRIAFTRPRARMGSQPDRFGGQSWWVLPNPSGLNAHTQLPGHAAALREVAKASGVLLHPITA